MKAVFFTPLYYKADKECWTENSYVKEDDEGILAYGEVTPYSVGRGHEVTEGVRPD